MRRSVRPLPLITALLAALTLVVGCGGTAGTPTAVPRSPSLAAALTQVPASVTTVQFYDLATAKADWGIGDLDGSAYNDDSKREQLRTFTTESSKAQVGSTLLSYSAVMADNGWGWNGLDVDWEVDLVVDGPPVAIMKLRDDLDMATVVDSFADNGMQQSGPDDAAPRFDWEKLGDGGPMFISGVTVIPAQHLVITGPAEFTRPDEQSSLASNATVSALVDGWTHLQGLNLTVGPDACLDPAAALGAKATPEQIEAYTEDNDWSELAAISGAAVAVVGKGSAQARTLYADAAAAEADLPRRQKLLADGWSVLSNEPYTDLIDAEVSADGELMTYRMKPRDGMAGIALRMSAQRDTPWAFCG